MRRLFLSSPNATRQRRNGPIQAKFSAVRLSRSPLAFPHPHPLQLRYFAKYRALQVSLRDQLVPRSASQGTGRWGLACDSAGTLITQKPSYFPTPVETHVIWIYRGRCLFAEIPNTRRRLRRLPRSLGKTFQRAFEAVQLEVLFFFGFSQFCICRCRKTSYARCKLAVSGTKQSRFLRLTVILIILLHQMLR